MNVQFLIAVRNMKASREFYKRVLDLDTVHDFGANVVLEGGLCLQTLDSWTDLLQKTGEDVTFGHNAAEVYLEAEDYGAFLERLKGVELVHPSVEHRWGQRAVRIYDPDRHIIEVGESMRAVCRRFHNSGLDVEGVARRMDVSVEYGKDMLD